MFNDAEINKLFVQTRKIFRRSLISPIITMILCIIGTEVIMAVIPIKNWDWKIVVAIGITVCSIAIFVVRAIEYDMDVKDLVYIMAIADFIKANSDEEVLIILQNIIGSGGHNETGCE